MQRAPVTRQRVPRAFEASRLPRAGRTARWAAQWACRTARWAAQPTYSRTAAQPPGVCGTDSGPSRIGPLQSANRRRAGSRSAPETAGEAMGRGQYTVGRGAEQALREKEPAETREGVVAQAAIEQMPELS